MGMINLMSDLKSEAGDYSCSESFKFISVLLAVIIAQESTSADHVTI